MSTISTTITQGVTLGTSGNYTSPLTITATGAVETDAGNAIYGPDTQAWTVSNQGTVAAPNGTGIYLPAGGTIVNGQTGVVGGLIFGGYGIIIGHLSGTGTVAGTLTNFGTIRGTHHLFGRKSGVQIEGGGGSLVNYGAILGGAFVGGTANNLGTIDGGLSVSGMVTNGRSGAGSGVISSSSSPGVNLYNN